MNQPFVQASSNRKYSRYYTYIEPIISDPIISGYFTLVASMLLTAFFIIFALSPTFSTIVGLFRKIEDQNKLVTKMDAKISNLILAQENYTQTEPLLPLLDIGLPYKPAPENIILGLIESASQSGVSIKTMQIGDAFLTGIAPPQKKEEPPIEMNRSQVGYISELKIPLTEFTVGVSGNKEDIRRFAGRIQNLSRITSLSVISIGADIFTIEPDPNKLSANISGVTYFLPKSSVQNTLSSGSDSEPESTPTN